MNKKRHTMTELLRLHGLLSEETFTEKALSKANKKELFDSRS